MKNENGITLVSLVIYILAMLIIIGIMGKVSIMFYENSNDLDDDVKDIVEYNKFNSYFIKEIKSANNSIDKISTDGTYILFTSGNSFTFRNNKIFYNDLEIAEDVIELKFSKYLDSNQKVDNTVVTVEINFKNYSKKMNYKIEEIY